MYKGKCNRFNQIAINQNLSFLSYLCLYYLICYIFIHRIVQRKTQWNSKLDCILTEAELRNINA